MHGKCFWLRQCPKNVQNILTNLLMKDGIQAGAQVAFVSTLCALRLLDFDIHPLADVI
jgi:hypothetical protein